MLALLAGELHATPAAIGLVPTLTTLGYAMGILLLAPLGDRYDRRTIILCKALGLIGALALAAMADSVPMLAAAGLVIGLAATLAQDIVPVAATLAPAEQRGKIVGTVMTGLLLGILLSRVVAGFVAEHAGWRSMFGAAAVSIALVGVALWRYLPPIAGNSRLSYLALLGSLGTLWRQHGALRRAALAQGLISVGFSAFWTTLAIMLHAEPFNLGSSAAGAFGLAGAAGALAAPLAGRVADRRGPELVTRLGTVLAAAAFVAMALAPNQLWLLAAGVVLFDLGTQASLIAHQTIIYGLDPAARSRLNAVLFVGIFTGMTLGAWLGSVLLAHAGWQGVCQLAAATSAGALLTRLWPATRRVAGLST